jgi:hypothetical protein
VLDDPRGVAAAASLRVIEAPGNKSGADAMVAWQPDERDELKLRSIETFPTSSPWQADGIAFENSSSRPASVLGRVPAGVDQVRLDLTSAVGEPLDLQILTRDGRHLAGRELTQDEQAALIGQGTGFVAGATYSDEYLNGAGDKDYLGLKVYYGARAVATRVEDRSKTGELIGERIIPATLQSGRIPLQPGTVGQPMIVDGAVTLNGFGLRGFTPAAMPVEASGLAGWLNAEAQRLGFDDEVSISAVNELRVSAGRLDLGAPLQLNGVTVIQPGDPALVDATDLAQRINALTDQTGVKADIGTEGDLVLRTVDGRDLLLEPADDDLLGEPTNALAIPAGRFKGSLVIQSKDLTHPVQLGIGLTGTPSDLSRLGFSTGVWIDGEIPEDLIIMTTGAGRGLISAQFQPGTVEPLPAMRAREFQIEFTEADRWKLTDTQTGTVLAERAYDPVAGIHYRGVQLSLSRPPAKGDVYTFDGNSDGVGDNAGILQLANLEKSRQFIPTGRTIAESWLDRLNTLGNLSNQAKIAQTALEVVHQQAIEARDRVSGVSLDEEAADLIRFQQAYQASARVIQTANQLFDLVANIR